MATLSDVENALVVLIDSVVRPGGASATGYPILIYPGWPDPASLDIGMVETAGKPAAAHISVYPLPTERNTTRYAGERIENPAPAKTYTLTTVGATITVGGAAPATYTPQNLAVQVNGKPYVVTATAGQTPAQLAAALRALIVVDVVGTTVSGAVITVPSTARIGALRVGGVGSTVRIVRQQEKQFQICVWNSNPTNRAALADLFDPALADTPRLIMPDGTYARLHYGKTMEDDFVQKQRVYRRSLIYTVEFATTITETAAELVAAQVDAVTSNGDPINTTYT